MVYSLARFRQLKPSVPFRLGGEWLAAGDRFFLRDAIGSIEVAGDADLLGKPKTGDLVVIKVKAADEFSVLAKDLKVHVRTRGGRPDAPKPHLTRFMAFMARVQDFFLEQGLTRLSTPSLVRCPGLEPTLEPFKVEVTYGRMSTDAYLPTSPEIHLKKALCMGWTDIFEIRPVFRRGEFSVHHDNEFHMLEWYRAFADLDLIEADLRLLVETLSTEGWVEGGVARVYTTDFAALFRDMLDFDLTPDTSAEQLQKLCARLDVHTVEGDTFNDLFHRLFIDRIEPGLKGMGPVIIRRFPPSQAALARIDESGWADRLEFFWRGLEIANGFNEVHSPDEQKRRWMIEIEERERLGTMQVPHDPDLIRAMRWGMPAAGGVAVGMERLYMACANIADIAELRLFNTADLFRHAKTGQAD